MFNAQNVTDDGLATNEAFDAVLRRNFASVEADGWNLR